jgi:transposase
MPAPRIAMRRIKEVLRLKLDCGLSHSQIASALRVSVGTISKYGRFAARAGLKWSELAAMSEMEVEARLMPPTSSLPTSARIQPNCALIHQELKRKGMTLQLLWEEYVETHGQEATYRYTQFCQRYHDFRVSLKRSMRQVHRAGEKLFADYAGQTLPTVDAHSGEIRQANIFVAVLGASNYTYACATARQTMADWLGALGQALAYMGGVAELITEAAYPQSRTGQAAAHRRQSGLRVWRFIGNRLDGPGQQTIHCRTSRVTFFALMRSGNAFFKQSGVATSDGHVLSDTEDWWLLYFRD